MAPAGAVSTSNGSRLLTHGDWPIAGLLALTIGLWVLGDFQRAGPGAEPFIYGASGLAWYLLGLLLLAWVASRTAQPRVPYRQALFLMSVCAPLIVLLLWAAPLVPEGNVRKSMLLVMLLTGAVVLLWGLRRVSGRPQLLAVWLCLGAAIGFAWASDALQVRPGIWYVPEAGESEDYRADWQDGERVLFEQPERIGRAVEQLGNREPGRPNAWFVGFAGFGGQKVFAEEIKLASRAIGARFGSLERSVYLINDRRDRVTYPLATAAGLRRTLVEVGRRMDRASDVLFLVLSSHGVEGAELVVENGGLPLTQLSGAELADALRDAGIRWKVVVISACFSGAFIDALKDDYSIVLSAAAPDKTSFGCSDDRELTYFGEAFFRDALPKATSLRAAFTRTRELIDARELLEGVEPSLPEAFFGVQGERHLAELLDAQ